MVGAEQRQARPHFLISINGLLGAWPQKDRFQSVGIDYG
jgi:hypothetical protein